MIIWTVFSILFLISTISADHFASIASLKALIEAQSDIPVMINDYVEKELERLDNLKKFAQEVKERNDKSLQNGDEAITHPINAFLLIKEMLKNWHEVVKLMQSNSADDFIHNVTKQQISKNVLYPTEMDLSGAVIGLLRLQDAYEMNTKDIADGKILNSKMRTVSLTAGDCFEIGRAAYNIQDFYHTILWMQEAQERVQKEARPTADLESILEYLAFSLYKQGNLKRALLLTDELYRKNPDHPRAKKNMIWYEDLLESEGVRPIDMRRKIPPMNNPRDNFDWYNKFYELCRQEVTISGEAQSQFYCYYKMDRPYLRLAPIKVEIVHQDPLVALFHNIISDEESRIIEDLATPKLNRSTVHNVKTGEFEIANYRISKSAWLASKEHEVIKRVNDRIDLATNLDLETAEELQVQNYGIGGHYEPHFDCSVMSEPEIGGKTIFLHLKAAVKATKNVALFWYNLMRSGQVDVRSYHAACPVLTGTKWTANKWFRERGQEWRRPCGLGEFDQEEYVGDLGAPEPKYALNIRSKVKKRK